MASQNHDDCIVKDAVLTQSNSDEKIDNESVPNRSNVDHQQHNIDEKPKRKEKFSKLVNTSINGAVINISNSSHVRVGSDIHYNIVPNQKKDHKQDEDVPLTIVVEKFFLNTSKLDFEHLHFVASHLGSEWKNLGRQLQFSDGQLEQFQLDYKNYKLKEVIYQMLLAWSREYPEQARLGQLARILWECNLQDIVQRMANQFEVK